MLCCLKDLKQTKNHEFISLYFLLESSSISVPLLKKSLKHRNTRLKKSQEKVPHPGWAFAAPPAHQAEPTHTSRWEKPTQVTNPSKNSLAAISCSFVLSTTKQKEKKNQINKQSAFLPGTAAEELPRQSWQYLHSQGMSLEATSPCKRMGPVTPARHHHLPQLQPSQRANPCRNSLLGIATHAPEQQSPSWTLLQTHPREKEAQTSRSGAGSPGAGGTGGGSS